mmetsp:Transcript_11014/g.12104  ORF Transcript_11014/g.12104 Transcript_11014/m.12104 type:complete len:165 (-) Transcript_11014:159-653(-)
MANPSYRTMGDHTESIRIEYDTNVTSYSKLLEIFWQTHTASYPRGRQYRSAIYYHNAEQKEIAKKSKKERQKALGKKIYTDIEKSKLWTHAEPYHQKYYLRGNKKMYSAAGLSDRQMVLSPLACKLNGLASGFCDEYADKDYLQKEIFELKMPHKVKKLVRSSD